MPETLLTAPAGASVVRLVRYRPAEALPFHAHDRATISLLLRGEMGETTEAHPEDATALSVVFKPAGIRHANRIGKDGAILLQICLGPDDEEVVCAAAPALREWRWVHGAPAAGPLLELAGAVHAAARVADRHPERRLRRDLLRVVRHLAAGRSPAAARRDPRPWLADATLQLAADDGPVSIRDVAARAAVHPVHFAREFRRCYGESPAGFRGRHRFRRATALLTGTREPLAGVACLAGFADQAHMTRDVVRRIGVTPGALRRLAESAAET